MEDERQYQVKRQKITPKNFNEMVTTNEKIKRFTNTKTPSSKRTKQPIQCMKTAEKILVKAANI